MRTGYGGSVLRPDYSSLSIRTGSVFCCKWTGYRTAGVAGSSSFADRHYAGRISVPGQFSCCSRTFLLVGGRAGRIRLGHLATIQRDSPLLIVLISFFQRSPISVHRGVGIAFAAGREIAAVMPDECFFEENI